MECGLRARAEARRLVEIATKGETDEEREEAERKLAELGSSWRGFPGQRRRGEPPAGVCVR